MRGNPKVERVAKAIVRGIRASFSREAAQENLAALSELLLDAQMSMLHPEMEANGLDVRTQLDVDILCVLSQELDDAACAYSHPDEQPQPEMIS